MRLFCMFVAALSVFFGPVGMARQVPAQPQSTFHSGAILVPLDIHVLDKNGKPVTGLTAKDFTVKEDGVAQRIVHFSIVNLVPQAPEPGARLVRSLTPTDSAVVQTRRVFLLVLGEGRLQGPSKGVDAMIQFVRTQLLPQDQVAVAAWNRATDFTTNHEQVLRVLGEFKRQNDKIQIEISLFTDPLASVYRVPEEYGDIQKDIDGVFHPPDGEGPAVRTMLPNDPTGTNAAIKDSLQRRLDIWMRSQMDATGNATTSGSGTATVGMPNPRQGSQTLDMPLDLSFEEFAAVSHATMSDVGRILAGVEYLRGVDGEKHLVFMSERGLFLPGAQSDRNLAGMANDARVAIDTIQTGGVSVADEQTFGPTVARPPVDMETYGVVDQGAIAALTGGLSSSYSYADQAFDHINRATTSEYLLGYYPANTVLDGGYRRIAVTVNRPGLTVVFRHSYFATAQHTFDRAQALAYTRIVTALSHIGAKIHDVPFTLSVSRTAGSAPALQLEVAISAAGLTFAPADGQQTATLDVVVFCYDKTRRRQIGDSWKSVNVHVPSDVYAQLPADAVTKYILHIPDLTWSVEVVVYDYLGDRLGIETLRVDLKK